MAGTAHPQVEDFVAVHRPRLRDVFANGGPAISRLRNPLRRRTAIRPGVTEVVIGGHVVAVALRRIHQCPVHGQRADTIGRTCLIHQREDRPRHRVLRLHYLPGVGNGPVYQHHNHQNHQPESPAKSHHATLVYSPAIFVHNTSTTMIASMPASEQKPAMPTPDHTKQKPGPPPLCSPGDAGSTPPAGNTDRRRSRPLSPRQA